MTFKNIKIPKRGGGTRLQRVKVLASGKYKFVKNLTKSSKQSPSKTGGKTTAKRQVNRKLTKKNKKKRTKTIPMAIVLGGLSGIVARPPGAHASPYEAARDGDYAGALNLAMENYTGFYPPNNTFDLKRAVGLHGLLIGAVVHKVCGWLGINRSFANLPSPLDKLRI